MGHEGRRIVSGLPEHLTAPPAADASYLTQTLRRTGVLVDGEVSRVEILEAADHMVSRAFRLRLQYRGAAPDAPARMFLKVPTGQRPTVPGSNLPKEIAFYTQVWHSPAGCVPRCFEAQWDAATGRSHILLEDLAESHFTATAWPIAPELAHCERMVRALAGWHAAWWRDPRLGGAVGVWPDAAAAADWADRFAGQVERFCAEAGDWLSLQRRDFLRSLVRQAPRVFAHGDRRPMTLIHGDAHAWNCFLAKDPRAARDVWFDWDNWRVDAGAGDLAYLIALHWYPERRQRFEMPLLDLYRDELVAAGVTDYDRADLQDDYRLAVLWQVATPVKQYAGGLPPLVWWSHLERILMAVDDLGCRELLAP
jgi:hypothetical protein